MIPQSESLFKSIKQLFVEHEHIIQSTVSIVGWQIYRFMTLLFIGILLGLLIAFLSGCGGKSREKAVTAPPGPKSVMIISKDDMSWDVTAFEVQAGQTVKITLQNTGKLPKQAMAHNFVLLALGTDPLEFAIAAVSAGETAYIPQDRKNQILAYTDLAGPGETVTIEFTAPEKAGDYEYLCSFPGHYGAGMKGIMTVR